MLVLYTGNACLILHEFFGLYLKRLDSNMVHNLFCGYCLCSLHCCCLGNIKSEDKKKKTNSTCIDIYQVSLYKHLGTFNCSWEQLFSLDVPATCSMLNIIPDFSINAQ